ncbi:MAG: YqiA/YcfP family alpha/beta fold hydrolase [Gammaproteobacteria bacterium]|nr:esterase [Pseudomonadales bacterium]MCP5347891.1 esterase [Pseudomonadales bacterium]
MRPESGHVIYLHGFLSSPQSKKARQTVEYWRERGREELLLVPELQGGPADSVAQVQAMIEQLPGPPAGIIGSSLGGFYATCLAEQYGLRAVVINPAVQPYRRWREYLGEHRNYYSDSVHVVTEQHVRELEELDVAELQEPDNYLLLAQTGDEVLDYRLAEGLYQMGTCIIQEGGSHSFENYAEFLPIIFNFLTIKN